jgi:hypothetical protein
MDDVTDGIRDIDLNNEVTLQQLEDLSGLPDALIITNVADEVFTDTHIQVLIFWKFALMQDTICII